MYRCGVLKNALDSSSVIRTFQTQKEKGHTKEGARRGHEPNQDSEEEEPEREQKQVTDGPNKNATSRSGTDNCRS